MMHPEGGTGAAQVYIVNFPSSPPYGIDSIVIIWHISQVSSMVDVAQLVERQTVALGVAGSSPVIHPADSSVL
jgi:hypothetical protein